MRIDEIKLLLDKARCGDSAAQLALMDAYDKHDYSQNYMCGFSDIILSQLEKDDKKWILPLAKAGNLNAISCLIEGAKRKYSIDEKNDTDSYIGEKITLIGKTYIDDGVTFNLNEREIKQLHRVIEELDNLTEMQLKVLYFNRCIDDVALLESLHEKYRYTFLADKLAECYEHGYINVRLNIERTQYYYELNGFTESKANSILFDNFLLVEKLYSKYNYKCLASELARFYHYGKEEQGLFRNKEKAKHFYTIAGVEYEEGDLNEHPYCVEYVIKGDDVTALKKIIDELTDMVGMPDNELGIYVPVDVLMKCLVGSDEYRGNLIYVKEEENGLVISAEVQDGDEEALGYAIKEVFPNLDVETNIEYPLF